MNFPAIEIQGSIISTELLSKIRSEQANYQQGKDFNEELTNSKLKDEISYAWQEAKGQWLIFQSKLARLKEIQTGTTETRNFWIIPLLTNLGYNLVFSRSAEELSGKNFPINYRDTNLDGFPVFTGSFLETLDKRPENKQLRVSPHALVQEYLNYSEHLYGIVTNGKQLRLLRDASRITRLSYVEFNLEKMMEEDLYSDFVLFYRLMHESRMPRKIDSGDESIIEKYHQEGLEAGSTIRDKLGNAVKYSIKSLANGFLNHPNNVELRESFNNNKIDAYDFYHHLLRIIYRLLFLFVIEERNLIFAESKTPETKRFGKIYYDYYSLLRLRKLAKKLPPPDAERTYDLWQSLVSTFSLFETEEIGKKMGIMSLNGELFGYDSICGPEYDLHKCNLSNTVLLAVLKSLTYFENENKVLISVNYGGLDVEEFGSVYEGLLELKLNINKIEGSEDFSCNFDASSERSSSGSHYTPEELVQPLIKHSLEYLIEDRLKEPGKYISKIEAEELTDKDQKINVLLNLKVCDVACGSGHILLSAARRIALEIARIENDEEQPNPAAIRKAMKDVVRHCIYGVDKNPLAVELCKVALWLETHNPGMPLSFLDNKIRCGDSIVGLAKIEELQKEIPTEAFNTLPGDDKTIAAELRNKNKAEVKQRKFMDVQLMLEKQKNLAENFGKLNQLPDDTLEDIARKKEKYEKIKGDEWWKLKEIADVKTAQFFIPKSEKNKPLITTDADYINIAAGNTKGGYERKISAAMAVGAEKKFFHWFLEFPDIMQAGGFDCILGNPPFLGGQSISGTFGNDYYAYIKCTNSMNGSCDLVTYFFRQIYKLLKESGYQALISTNTICQGVTRENGLEKIVSSGGDINFAVKSMTWPGRAAVIISLVSIYKGVWLKSFVLNREKVDKISSYLDIHGTEKPTYTLVQNKNKSFMGSTVFGKGFYLEKNEASKLLLNQENKDVLYPILNGEDFLNDIHQKPSRWVINFFNWSEEKAKHYSACYKIVLERVKPQRINQNILSAKKKWWQFHRLANDIYENRKNYNRVLVTAITTKTFGFSFIEEDMVFSNAVIVFMFEKFATFSIMHQIFIQFGLGDMHRH